MTFNASSTMLASAGDGTLCVWDLTYGVERMRVSYAGLRVADIAFSPDNQYIALCGDTYHDDHSEAGEWIEPDAKAVRLWDCRASAEIELDGFEEKQATSVAFHPQVALLAAGADSFWSHYNPVQLWDAASKHVLDRLRDDRSAVGAANPITKLAFNPTGTIVAFNSGFADIIELWGIVTPH